MTNILNVGVSKVLVFFSGAFVRSIRTFYDAKDCNEVRSGVAGNKMTYSSNELQGSYTHLGFLETFTLLKSK
jgi:hypothetical protein